VLNSPPARRLGAGLLVGAGALAVVALLVREPAATPTRFVESVALEAPPSTVATLPPSTERPTTTAEVESPRTTLPLSPLAAQLPPPSPATPSQDPLVAPAALWIDDLALWAPIRGVGFQADGQLEIPDETEVGWYRFGSVPGRAGSTVLAAHVTWNDTVGPFFRLPELEPGDQIKVLLDDGSTRRYEVFERAQYGKSELPADRIWTREGDETLVLITCGGDFNRQIRRYTDNIVIYAVPVADSEAPGQAAD
jgi:LPXTG-site transpeptidase (sortase) family protein